MSNCSIFQFLLQNTLFSNERKQKVGFSSLFFSNIEVNIGLNKLFALLFLKLPLLYSFLFFCRCSILFPQKNFTHDSNNKFSSPAWRHLVPIPKCCQAVLLQNLLLAQDKWEANVFITTYNNSYLAANCSRREKPLSQQEQEKLAFTFSKVETLSH